MPVDCLLPACGAPVIAKHVPTDTRDQPRVDDRRVISEIVHVLKSSGRCAMDAANSPWSAEQLFGLGSTTTEIPNDVSHAALRLTEERHRRRLRGVGLNVGLGARKWNERAILHSM
jgi:hypothetical protein